VLTALQLAAARYPLLRTVTRSEGLVSDYLFIQAAVGNVLVIDQPQVPRPRGLRRGNLAMVDRKVRQREPFSRSAFRSCETGHGVSGCAIRALSCPQCRDHCVSACNFDPLSRGIGVQN